jgi:hypothetical protein
LRRKRFNFRWFTTSSLTKCCEGQLAPQLVPATFKIFATLPIVAYKPNPKSFLLGASHSIDLLQVLKRVTVVA